VLTNALLAGVLTAALSPVLIVALRRLGTLDTPTHRSSHTMPTVRGGGLAPALAGTGVLALGATALGAPRLGVVVAAAGFATVGLIEDVRGIAVTRRLALEPMDAMKVAHHGSADPGLAALLATVRPRVAVVPVGRNPYGHPHAATLAALHAVVPVVRRTDRDGTVRLRADGNGLRVETTR